MPSMVVISTAETRRPFRCFPCHRTSFCGCFGHSGRTRAHPVQVHTEMIGGLEVEMVGFVWSAGVEEFVRGALVQIGENALRFDH